MNQSISSILYWVEFKEIFPKVIRIAITSMQCSWVMLQMLWNKLKMMRFKNSICRDLFSFISSVSPDTPKPSFFFHFFIFSFFLFLPPPLEQTAPIQCLWILLYFIFPGLSTLTKKFASMLKFIFSLNHWISAYTQWRNWKFSILSNIPLLKSC